MTVSQAQEEQADISIITCSYNQAQFLETTLRSVLAQTGVKVEYIVIDGASTDGSPAILQRYGDAISYWASEQDAGQSEAINKGLKRARGKIIGWLCSDDVLLPGALSRVVEIFARNPRIDAVYGNAVLIDTSGNALRPKREIGFYPWLMVADHNYIPQPAMFWRRSLHEQLGYLREDLHLTMDLEWWLRWGRGKRVVIHVDEYFAGMRCHGGQKVLVHPKELGDENKALRAAYGPTWMNIFPAMLIKVFARAVRVVLKLAIGGYSKVVPPSVLNSLRSMHHGNCS